MNEKAMEVWLKTWPAETHETEYAAKRIKSAKSAKLTPVQISQEDLYGYFQGEHGRYETFLDYCSCGDFRRSKLPCKHIYRLAMELGVMNEEFKSDVLHIITPKSEKMSLDEVIDIVEGLSKDVQKQLLQMAVDYGKGEKRFEYPLTPIIEALLQSGLIVYASEEKKSVLDGPVYVLRGALDRLGIAYDKKMKAVELKKYCRENLTEVLPPIVSLTFFGSVPVKNVHLYLHRKYDVYVDYDMTHWELDGVPLLETQLPDDAITAQLIKRGYYQPK